MNTGAILLSILILVIIGTSYTSGQGVLIPFGPYGRQISHYNLLQQGVSQHEFQKLSKRFSYYEEVINFFASQYAEILEEVKALKSNAGDPICPKLASSIGAKIVDGKCLSVEVIPNTANDAKLHCMAQGGILAEPLFTDYNFFKNLYNAFPDKLSQFGAQELYVGIETATWRDPFSGYIYLSNGAHIPDTSSIWVSPPTMYGSSYMHAYIVTGNNPSAIGPPPVPATPFPPGTWKLNSDYGLTPRSYICQFPTL